MSQSYYITVLGTTNCTTDADCSGVSHAKCEAKVCKCADSYKQANTTACILNGNLFNYRDIHVSLPQGSLCDKERHVTSLREQLFPFLLLKLQLISKLLRVHKINIS